jgi:putative phosphoribosyl transferase
MNHAPYRDRAEAGRAILSALAGYRNEPGVLVLGLARGGVPVAAQVADDLGADLDVAVVRKLGVPGHEELALGAISPQRIVLNDALIRSLGVSDSALDAVIERERHELARRETAYRDGGSPASVTGRTVILVDDGIATGASMHVAALDARAQDAARVVVAVPTAPRQAKAEFDSVADEFVCPYTPEPFLAVGLSYTDFRQVSDGEVRGILSRYRR